MRLSIKAAALPLATSLSLTLSILTGATTTAVAGEANWARQQVAKWELSMIERFLGKEAAARRIAEPQIIGGNVAAPGRWPAQAALLIANIPDNADALYCGASVIGERFILTAAHCLDFLDGPSQINVLTNTQSLASGGTRHEVAKFRIHPGWNPATSDFDVAIIKIKGKITGIPAAQRAQFISTVDEETEFAPPKEKAFVTGWGDTQPGAGKTFPTALNEVQVPIVRRNVCNGPGSYDGLITPRMICAGLAGGGKDSCQGDSGGPLFVRNANNKYRIQVGVVSWGIGCALPDLYGVYSRLAVLGAWVQKMMDKL